MRIPRYHLYGGSSGTVYSFISKGPAGRIEKIIQYAPTNIPGIYNLSLCDRDPVSGELNDDVTTNNGDTEKVLATVAFSIYLFTDQYSRARIFARGSSASRTRLYRIIIHKHFSILSRDFQVFGLTNNKWEFFVPAFPYDAFLVIRKK